MFTDVAYGQTVGEVISLWRFNYKDDTEQRNAFWGRGWGDGECGSVRRKREAGKGSKDQRPVSQPMKARGAF